MSLCNSGETREICFERLHDFWLPRLCIIIKTETMEKLKMQLKWFNHFVDLIQDVDSNLYDQACEYADGMENLFGEETTDNGYNVEQVKEYYLNSGFPRYSEEPFLSEYNDSDWIEHANESELEL